MGALTCALYQSEMLKGVWSRDNQALAENTINARVEIAADFLTWASDKGLRTLFVMPTVNRTYFTGNPTNSVDQLPKQIEARKGKLRENKRRLGFPEEKNINTWLQRIYEEKGLTEGLIAELILETAVRREEAACWRVDTLSRDTTNWRIANPNADLEHQAVLVDLKYGTKGKEYGRDHGDKIGPVGTIRVPMLLARKLHHYREAVRPKTLDLAIRKGRTLAEQRRIRDEAVHLFLNPKTGQRYTGENIYEFWRSVNRPKGWSPHQARDFWACSLLWRRIEQQKELLQKALDTRIDEVILQALRLNAISIIQLEIQPQLRHVSNETTLIYLQWLGDRLSINLNLYQRWVEELTEDDGGEDL